MSKDGGDTASLISMENSHFYRTALCGSQLAICQYHVRGPVSYKEMRYCWTNFPKTPLGSKVLGLRVKPDFKGQCFKISTPLLYRLRSKLAISPIFFVSGDRR